MAATISSTARTVLGSLTTTFTPAPSCFYLATACQTCDYGWFAQTCVGPAPGTVIEDNTDCWPPRSGTGSASFEPNLYSKGFYSPGLVCPAGFTTACSAVGTTAGLYELGVLSSLSDGETGVGCCPTGFSCASSHTCVSTAFGTDSFPVVSCSSNDFGPVSFLTLPDAIAVSETLTTYQLQAPLIQINWQSSDLVAATTTTASSSLSTPSKTPSAPTSSTTISSSASTSSNANASSNSSSLSAGAKAGIGIGAAILVLVLLGVSVFLARRHRRNRMPRIHEAPGNVLPYELPSSGGDGFFGKRKTGSAGRMSQAVHELGSGMERRAEMAG